MINEDWTDGGRVHLLDIRPFPRATENKNDWHYEGINVDKYLSAFNNFDCNPEKEYGTMVSMRKIALQKEIARYKNLKFIIAPGAEHMKLKFFESMFENINFDSTVGASTRNVNKKSVPNVFHIAGYNKDEISFKIIVCKFFNSSNGIGLEGLKELATKHLITQNAIQ